MQMNSEQQVERIDEFWKWFTEFRGALTVAATPSESMLESILERLQRVDRHLYFELCVNQTPNEFVVTTDGRTEFTSTAELVVARAPNISGWRVIATKPAMPSNFTIQNSTGDSLSVDRMWFLPLERKASPTLLGLRVGVEEMGANQISRVRVDVLRILDSLLGEVRAAEVIQHVEVVSLPVDPAKAGYIELAELPRYIDWKRKRSTPETT